MRPPTVAMRKWMTTGPLEAGKILVDGAGAQALDVIDHPLLHPRQAAAVRVGAFTGLEDFQAWSLLGWASNDDAHED